MDVKQTQLQQQPQVIIYVTAPIQSVPVSYPQPLAVPIEKQSSKAQSRAVVAGGVIFVSAGMNMAKGLYWTTEYPDSSDFYISTWFIGVIMGALLAAPLVKRLEKKSILAVSCLLILIEGILYTSLPHDDDVLWSGRTLNGIAFGLTLIPFLVHTSENCSKTNRGLCGFEQYCFTIGIALQIILTSFLEDHDEHNRVHGILDIIIFVLASSSLGSIIESPIFHLQKGNEAKAFQSLVRLDTLRFANTDTYSKFEICKDYVRKQETVTLMECISKSLWPLTKMIVFRSMILAFTFSIPLSQALISSSYVNSAEYWAPTIGACMRLAGSCLALFFINGFSRKLPSMISSAIMGILIVISASSFASYDNMHNSIEMGKVTWFCIITQLMAGLYAPYTSVHLSEAFPLKLKPYCIAICLIVEQLLHIIIVSAYDYQQCTLESVLLAHGLLICAGFLLMCLTMPETKGTTLKEAQERFKQLFYFKMH